MTNDHVSQGEPTSTARKPSGDSGAVYEQGSSPAAGGEAEANIQADLKRSASGTQSGRFSGERARQAGKKGGLARARRVRQAVGGARPEGDLRARIREMLEEDEEQILASIRKAIREGRDVRALTSLLDRVYGEDTAVQRPSTLDELALLSREERRILMAQLEDELGISGPYPTRQLLASKAEAVEETGTGSPPSAG